MTTLKVRAETRDRVKARAGLSGQTLDQAINALLDQADRADRFAALRQAIAATPPDQMESWRHETESFSHTVPVGDEAF
jgi:phosphoserine phosphatase